LLPAVEEALVGTAFEDAKQIRQTVFVLDDWEENSQRLKVQLYEVRDPYYDRITNPDRDTWER